MSCELADCSGAPRVDRQRGHPRGGGGRREADHDPIVRHAAEARVRVEEHKADAGGGGGRPRRLFPGGGGGE